MNDNAEKRAEYLAAMQDSQMRKLRVVSGKIFNQLNGNDIGASLSVVLLAAYFRGDEAEPALIADDTLIPRQTITSILDKLEKLNFLTRVNHASDRRRKNLVLTEAGQKKAIEIWLGIHDYEQKVLSVLTDAELREFNRINEKIGARIRELDK